MPKYASIVAVAVPVLMAIIMGYIGKRLLIAQVEIPSSCLAGMMATCTAMICGAMAVVVLLLLKVIGSQGK